MSPEELAAADQRCVWHPFTQMKAWCDPSHEPLVIVGGQGAMLLDSRGREYFDGNSSIWTNIHGHCHPRIVEAVRGQLGRLDHASFLGSSNDTAIRLAAALVDEFEGSGLSRVFFSDNGSTAVEAAVKMAAQFWQLMGEPGRRRFAAFEGAYHGDTAGAASLGGIPAFTDRFAAIHFEAVRVGSVGELERGADASEIAAVIIEPLVRGAAGVRLWPPGILRELRAWCDTSGALLIFDEVLTGFGRTGSMLACQREGVYPDLLCLAKGLTGGTLPLSATLTTERVFEAFLGEFEELKTFFYGHSYCGNPIGCAAALASLEVFREERTLERLPALVRHLEGVLARLASNPRVRETRQCGLIAGIELGDASGGPLDWRLATGARVCQAARKHGLLTRPILDTVTLIPPLCSTPAQLDAAAEALERALEEILP
ncbi:MAG: adenosylmethionine--8-amino-7-oxononanoate transaminase [Terrimicrobiaceae bacterium]|nr:adenosylmethionine--8-amino-7-oxononanoate transaminase [Terrimicrobiaceae bacterium]